MEAQQDKVGGKKRAMKLSFKRITYLSTVLKPLNKMIRTKLTAQKPPPEKKTKKAPTVSVIVPAYNVEDYIAACLDSILSQSFKDFEIIIVVDGATDRTHEIALRYKRRDKRIHIHCQENMGLSGARNSGAALARGEFIWFIDSDDTIQPDAISRMVKTLQKSGSDFVVASYNRLKSDEMKEPAQWILSAHKEKRIRTTLKDHPDILVNAVAWSKMLRRRFWTDNNLSFRLGALYEDQLWSAQIYSLATSFDVLPNILINWRIRENKSSITQQTSEIKNLLAFAASARASIDELRKLASNEIADHRATQILSNNMRDYIRHLIDSDLPYWKAVSEALRLVSHGVNAAAWRDVPAQFAALEWLLLREDYDRARSYIEQGGLELANSSVALINGEYVLKVPFWDDVSAAFTQNVLSVSLAQFVPDVELRKAYWIAPGRLAVEGWAYVSPIEPDLIAHPTTLELVSDEKDPHFVSVPLRSIVDPNIDRVCKHSLNDYRPFGFEGVIDIDEMQLHTPARYLFRFCIGVGNFQYFVDLKRVLTWGAIGSLTPGTSPEGKTAALLHGDSEPVLLNVRSSAASVRELVMMDDHLNIVLTSKRPLESIRITALNVKKEPVSTLRPLLAKVSSIGDNTYRAIIPVRSLPTLSAKSWVVRAMTSKGDAVSLAWPDGPVVPESIEFGGAPTGVAVIRTDAGNLGLRWMPHLVHIESLDQVADHVMLTGRLIGHTGPVSVRLRDHRQSVPCDLRVHAPDNNFTLSIPLTSERWGCINPLAVGRYEIVFQDFAKKLDVTIAPDVAATLPKEITAGAPVAGRLERHPKNGQLMVIVQPTLSLSEQGARNRRKFIEDHKRGRHELDRRAVLFRTYYGETATCNSLGIHHELLRRNADLDMYWTVQDLSVPIPEGGIPVVANSRRWYELMSKAKYIFDNVHQPDFFKKREGQIIVQTLHGYPFKRAGLPYWKSAGYPAHRIESFLKRHDQWDYLISPAPYATPLLERDFPSTGKTLEIGYPRNDIFFLKEARAAIRERTRKILGIASHVTAVLYAPTYRDNLSTNEFKANMVNYLDAVKCGKVLGDEFVILARGHGANARSASRPYSDRARVIDVTDYPEISHLCLASDVGIMDYSSLRFDYALTGNPMLFLVPDLAAYRDDIRGWMLPYEETAPGPLLSTTDQVIDCLRRLTEISEEYLEARSEFLRKYMPLEDGNAGARLVDAVFEGVGAKPKEPVDQ